MFSSDFKHRFKEQAKAWWQASRPAFYIATLVPLLIGYVAASRDGGVQKPGIFALILLCSFFLHLSANLANDVFDHLQGVDGGENIGGSRVLQEGKISLRSYAIVLPLLFAASLALGGIGVAYTGLTGIWAIILFAIASSFFYVAPPVRYGHRALGEVMVFLNMGVIMTAGTYYVLTGVWSAKALALSLPVGLMVAGILYYQSLPEIETDKAAGKHTLANVLGPERAVLLFRIWWPTVWLLIFLLVLGGAVAWPALAGIILSVPLHQKAVKLVRNCKGDWLSLDAHGHLVRKMYLMCGFFLIVGLLAA